MNFISTWKVKPGKIQEAVDRFLGSSDDMPAGVKSIARWHRVDMQGGVHLIEADDPGAMAQYSAGWADLLDIETYPAMQDAQAVEAYSRIPGTQAHKKKATAR